jgi:uncharacterized membrane protein
MHRIPIIELLIIFVAWLAIAAYHIHLFFKVRKAPVTTAIGITNHARRKWAQHVMLEGHDILAVQTLQNQVMDATFLASTAILVGLGLIGVAFRPGIYSEISHALNLAGAKSETLWLFQQPSGCSARFGCWPVRSY